MIRGRYAPTPSGELHIGNARTALLAWLQVRSTGGTFIMRMEDIDKPRSKPELAREALSDLRWLGIDWDEGPDKGGSFGPYVQSERQPLYEAAIDRLTAKGLLYPCYCSRAELAAVASAPHGLSAEGPAYPGSCRHLNEGERQERAQRKTPALRFAVPDRPIVFHDRTAGPQSFQAGEGGDFVVRRADGIVSYQLAVVVDDAAMEISDVLRGCDLIDSTPRQLLIYEALDKRPPRFAHVPLLLGADGKRLAKRHGAHSIRAMRESGLRPELIVGALAAMSGLLDRIEPITPLELASDFSLTRISDQPTVVDEGWLQRLRIL
ncbi:glutamyl-Q tRNA(Asp) ligase [Paenibacillus darwinianus]|uniref:Glutamyl-Q tRNA(Asp) synthetase n=1 Tax=Paenibacillus darwinianus TaxID=1380763 RepID=A0A9W5RZH9_9BACL|nr:tRNA glutamyl-Q(34) synthetase GluQRS [Paenibacillus darwinianus]EXX85770.1 glutamyl-Q tRNA(Asp) ligase [Paenibacillus darwinianus]EXX85959.1 glutamyl-Q tRNA(Asp) ligase [Paenibacillus darwinianus]EXX88667.1 glutamyl-Q tRNA(Asp) ligase [Paenibacillus darwinianus]